MSTQRNAEPSTGPVDLSQLTAPEEFRRAIVKDPYASIYRFDFDAVRGEQPIPDSALERGGTIVPRSGYYFDLDGRVINWYREGDRFPELAAVRGDGGRYFFVTDRKTATTSDLRFIVLRAGWDGDVREIHIR